MRRRDLMAIASEPEPPDMWAMAADVVRAELADRSLRAAEGLSWEAWIVAVGLSAVAGAVPVAYVRRALDRATEGACDFDAAMHELIGLGLAETFLAAESGAWKPVLMARLRLDVEIPGTE